MVVPQQATNPTGTTSAVSALMNRAGSITGTSLAFFEHLAFEDYIEIFWTLSHFEANQKFVVYREVEGSGEFIPFEAEILNVTDLSYRFLDTTVELNSRYRYRIDTVDGARIQTLFITEHMRVRTPKLKLFQNFPNPFNPSTRILFNLPEKSHVSLTIYDISGRLVTTLVDSELSAGKQVVNWTGRNANGKFVTSGIYLYELKCGKSRLAKKMILIR